MNPASGSYDPALPDRLRGLAEGGGAAIERVIHFPDNDLPTIADLDAAGIDILAIHTGDGTINSAIRRLAGWHGAVLPLPGGTMNLLSRHLHGDASPDAILSAALVGDYRLTRVAMIAGEAQDSDLSALVGLFAGPTTAWGDVRETIRRVDLGALAEAIPRAITATFEGDQVRLEGDDQRFPAIYVEPVDGLGEGDDGGGNGGSGPTLRVMGFLAAGAAELFQHGFAWLGGDFRNGPKVELGEAARITIISDGPEMGLLIDGEKGRDGHQLSLRAVDSPVRFVATRATSAADIAPKEA